MEFESFVRSYQDMVYSTALRILADPPSAQDIAQDTFLQAFRWYNRIGSDPGAGGWLRTTARNLALNELMRHRKRYVRISDDSAAEPDNARGTPRSDGFEWLYEQSDLLRRAFLTLPDHLRVPLTLYHYEDLDYEEIRVKLGVSMAKVKTDIMRGRARLRAAIEQLEHGDDKAD